MTARNLLQQRSCVCAVIFCAISVFCTTNALKSDAHDLVITSSEKRALELLKTEVMELLPEKFMKTDLYLIRWLRAAHMSVPGARNLLMQTVQWRKQENMTGILSEDWSDLEEMCKSFFDGFDKDNRPVRSIDVGDCDLRTIGLQGKMTRLRRYFQYGNEKLMRMILQMQEEMRKPVTRFVLLLDASGISLRKHIACPNCLSTMIQWYTSSDAHYPEFFGEAIIINASPVAVVGLNAVRPFMHQDIKDRIRMFDSNKKVWMNYLDSRIDRSQRRDRYGGTIKEDDV